MNRQTYREEERNKKTVTLIERGRIGAMVAGVKKAVGKDTRTLVGSVRLVRKGDVRPKSAATKTRRCWKEM